MPGGHRSDNPSAYPPKTLRQCGTGGIAFVIFVCVLFGFSKLFDILFRQAATLLVEPSLTSGTFNTITGDPFCRRCQTNGGLGFLRRLQPLVLADSDELGCLSQPQNTPHVTAPGEVVAVRGCFGGAPNGWFLAAPLTSGGFALFPLPV